MSATMADPPTSRVVLAIPTVELVTMRCDEFDSDPSTRLGEDALGQLWAHFPRNTEAAHVLLKVLALNSRYSAQVRDIDIETLARHIAGLSIDPQLAEGSASTVHLITHCGNLRHYFSFATKYCSWHNPDAYPIYDRNVDACLWSYKKENSFAKFQHQDLWDYARLRDVVTEFRTFFKLDSFNFKAIDKFLWSQGDSLLRAIEAIKGHGQPVDETLFVWEHINEGDSSIWRQTVRKPL